MPRDSPAEVLGTDSAVADIAAVLCIAATTMLRDTVVVEAVLASAGLLPPGTALAAGLPVAAVVVLLVAASSTIHDWRQLEQYCSLLVAEPIIPVLAFPNWIEAPP